jgi:hypothetical protein
MDGEIQRKILGFSKGELEAVRDWNQILAGEHEEFLLAKGTPESTVAAVLSIIHYDRPWKGD